MTARWVRTADLVGLPGMPNGPRPIQLHGPRRGWVCREAAWGARTILEWLESSLPGETRRALREARGEACAGADVPPPVPAPVLPSGDGRPAVADARVEIVACHTVNQAALRSDPFVTISTNGERSRPPSRVRLRSSTRTSG